MSAIHTGSIAARLTADGLLQFTGTSQDHAITDWTLASADQDPQGLIPAQRAGNTYEAVVLQPDGGEPR